MMDDKTNLAYWFPMLEAADLPVPKTHLVHTDADLSLLLDGETPEGYEAFVREIRHAALDVGYPAFLRTGHGSGKHDWGRTCHLGLATDVGRHVYNLVEWSHLVDLGGLPTQDWAVRAMIPTVPLFRCEAWQGFPVAREFRAFVREDDVEHVQPYWPPDAVADGRPDASDWGARLAEASRYTGDEAGTFGFLAGSASGAVGGGYWSVDLLEDRDGKWWITDMAEGDRSFRYEA